MTPKYKLQAFGIIFLGLVLLASCFINERPKAQMIVVSYAEFGPQVMAHELIGNEWYQWNTQGPDDPNTFDDVKVVIYRNMSLEDVKRKYPVNEKKKEDFSLS